MSFSGMNPDQGREVATAIRKAGTDIQDQIDQLTSQVTGVEWVGPDYDAFVADWNAFVSSDVATATDLFNTKADALDTHADEQDDTSNQN